MIELADKWTRQPQRPTGVSAEWETRGLVALFDTRLGVELIHNNRASNLSTTLSPAAGGMAADFSGTANQQYAHRPAYATTGAMTLVILFDVDALSSYGALIAKQASPTTYCPYELRLGNGSTDSTISWLRGASGTYTFGTASGSNLIAAGDKAVHLIWRISEASSSGSAFVNGTKYDFSAAGVTPLDNGSSVWIGRRSDGATQLDGRIYYVALFNRAISDAEAQALTANPWQLYAKRPKRIFLSTGGGSGVTGTAAITLAGDTSSATGTTTVKGSAAPTLGNDTSSASGTVGSVSGTAAITLANDTSSAQGTTSIGGTGAVTLGNDFSTASGAVGSAITGSAAITLGGDTSSATGTTKILGSAAIILGADFSTAQGTTKILGSAAVTLGDDFATAFGTAGTPTTVVSPRGLTIRIGLAL